jgi:hypothetical protein
MATDAANAFEGWFQYLKQEDFEYLIQYIENIKNGIPNHEMIILAGSGRNGKTSLMYEIRRHLGNEFCNFGYLHSLIHKENIKPLLLLQECEIYDTCLKYKHRREICNTLINFIKFGVSFIITVNTGALARVNTQILERSRIIMMNHTFEGSPYLQNLVFPE